MPTIITRGSGSLTNYGFNNNVTPTYAISYYLIAGGGGGGGNEGGGGGAGGFLRCINNNFFVTPGKSYTIAIGGGGVGGGPGSSPSYLGTSAGNGTNTTVSTSCGATLFNAVGGGSGSTVGNGTGNVGGKTGGSGGGEGGGGGGSHGTHGCGTLGQGNAGAAAYSPGPGAGSGGGGGGAGSVGVCGASGKAGNGGSGANTSPYVIPAVASAISVGQIVSGNVVFAGGGGGGSAPGITVGTGGSGGGGSGVQSGTGVAGTALTGGGAGGGGGSGGAGGTGGSGAAIISYPSLIQLGTGGSVFNNGANTTGSVFFNSSSQYLYLNGPAGLTIGSNNFTIEAWINFSSFSGGVIIADFRPLSVNGFYPQLSVTSTGNLSTYINGANQIVGNTTLSINTWYHAAWVRNNGTSTIYVNGSSVGSIADTNSYSVGASRPVIATNGYQIGLSSFPGYISNLRVVNGTAIYTGNFTTPTTQLTAVANTVLLMCQDSSGTTFHDNSANNYTITGNSNPTISNVQPILTNYTGSLGSTLSGGFATTNANTFIHVFTTSSSYTA
jgi:Concanavalin A-like lectin/glucanases superfamily